MYVWSGCFSGLEGLWIKKGREEGIAKGIQKGHKQGRKEGRKQGAYETLGECNINRVS